MVFDTVVFAYALLGVTLFREEALASLQKAKEIWVPDLMKAELTNVIWQSIRHKKIERKGGLQVLRDAEALITETVKTNQLWEYALELAIERNHPAYDTFFVALAAARNTKVITSDKKLCQAFPELTISPAHFLKK